MALLSTSKPLLNCRFLNKPPTKHCLLAVPWKPHTQHIQAEIICHLCFSYSVDLIWLDGTRNLTKKTGGHFLKKDLDIIDI